MRVLDCDEYDIIMENYKKNKKVKNMEITTENVAKRCEGTSKCHPLYFH